MNTDNKKTQVWKMVALYVFIGVVAYGVIYYFLIGRQSSTNNMSNVSTDQSQNPQTSDLQPTTSLPPSDTQNSPTSADNSVLTIKTDPSKGSYYADPSGMTLYVYDQDTAGVSNCTGTCATNWPPYIASNPVPNPLPTGITVITRPDGSMQYALNDKPLYYYVSDTVAGDLKGDGIGGIWHIVAAATPSPTPAPSMTPTTAPSTY